MTETESDPDLVANGTYEELNSGVLRLTVDSATGPDSQAPAFGEGHLT